MPESLIFLTENSPGVSNDRFGFIYLRLGTKEIAAITHRAVRSVYTAKNRLKKKMGLAQDADLQDFLHSL